MNSIRQNLNQWFELDTRNTSIQTEFLAGLTTFIAMSYIVIVMPQMWSTTGMDFHTGYLATIIAMAIGTSVMGIAANYPIAIAPGIGINAYLIYTVAANGVSWQETIGISVAAAAIFTILSLTSFRQIFIESIPESLKIAIGVGIGFFISFIGLQNGHLIIGHPSTLVSLGTFADPVATLTIMGLLLAVVLMVLRVPGSIFLSMAGVTVAAYLLGFLSLPDSWFSLPPDINEGFWQFRLDHVGHYGMEVFVVLLLTLFDTTGTLLGVGRQAGIIRDGHFPHLQSSLLADSIGSFVWWPVFIRSDIQLCRIWHRCSRRRPHRTVQCIHRALLYPVAFLPANCLHDCLHASNHSSRIDPGRCPDVRKPAGYPLAGHHRSFPGLLHDPSHATDL
jgi:AGZA family xanthine/uracil permease-like MFS transporter